jgi:hypothetical protein
MTRRNAFTKDYNPAPTLDSAVFHPWFDSRTVWHKIMKLVPREYLLKMHDYFDRYGCISCKRRDRAYSENGMCNACFTLIGRRLRRFVKRRFDNEGKIEGDPMVSHIVDSEKLARRLLKDLIPEGRVANRSNRKYLQKNPAATVGVLSRGRYRRLKGKRRSRDRARSTLHPMKTD